MPSREPSLPDSAAALSSSGAPLVLGALAGRKSGLREVAMALVTFATSADLVRRFAISFLGSGFAMPWFVEWSKQSDTDHSSLGP